MNAAFLDEYGDLLPERIELKPGRLKWLGIFAISAGFVAIAAFVGPDEPVVFWGSGGFFLVCAIVAATQMIGVGAKLVLDSDGFTCTTLFRSFRRTWVECSEFYPVRVGGNAMVGFASETDQAKRLAAVSEAIAGTQAALPDTFGFSAEELADVMNRFRARAIAGVRP